MDSHQNQRNDYENLKEGECIPFSRKKKWANQEAGEGDHWGFLEGPPFQLRLAKQDGSKGFWTESGKSEGLETSRGGGTQQWHRMTLWEAAWEGLGRRKPRTPTMGWLCLRSPPLGKPRRLGGAAWAWAVPQEVDSGNSITIEYW